MSTIQYLQLSEVAKECPGRPSANAVWRWCRKGVKSRSGETVRLAHIRIGGRIFVTLESLHRFFAEVAKADEGYFVQRTANFPTPIRPTFGGDTAGRLAGANKLLDEYGF
ncbi:MAG: DUF1580 domain-containing protein [Candidatus Hydrogenedentes bacterium]|nr:DUF1580 domain-containing protein [Candidatus Hydrogenedentota bacterium]